MKRLALSMTLAATCTVSLTGVAQGDEPRAASAAPAVQELVGQGTDVCPSKSLCLYQDHDLNAHNKDGKVWIFPVAEERHDFTLEGHAAQNRPSSAYMNVSATKWTAYLFADERCGYDGDRNQEAIQFLGSRRLDVLRDVNGRAKRYGYFYSNGRWDKDKRWGITEETLNLNDRAGCVTTGAWDNTYAMRPSYTGSM